MIKREGLNIYGMKFVTYMGVVLGLKYLGFRQKGLVGLETRLGVAELDFSRRDI